MSPELARLMQEQLAAFKEKFGREAGPEDPVFFDPDTVHAAEEAGLEPERVLTALGFDESD